MTFKTLESIALTELLHAFNTSFSDYLVPLHLTEQQLKDKIISDNIQLDLSAGAFDGNQLIGFILHGYDVIKGLKVVYNAGTGVIPSHRGNKITAQLYNFILPVLKEIGTDKILLEVITGNERAIKIYGKIGFEIIRTLNCNKGTIAAQSPENYAIKNLNNYDWAQMQSFWDIHPSWQNSIRAVDSLKMTNISVGVYHNEEIAGYLIYNPISKKIQQFGVHKDNRKKGIAKKLFHHIATNYSEDVAVINVDDNSKATAGFLESLNLKPFVRQYEMEWNLKM